MIFFVFFKNNCFCGELVYTPAIHGGFSTCIFDGVDHQEK